MMSLLAPSLLLLGLAAAVPLILHLFQRQHGPRVVFPAVRYLQRAERESARRIRLRQVLLLALRVLAIVLLALAAARPLVPFGGTGHAPTSVVLILDNSLSSGAVVGEERVLDELARAALAALESAGSGDRFWLIRAGESWKPAVAGDASTVAAAVRATRSSAGAADLGREVDRAASILATEPADRAREIHVLSDLQRTGVTAAVDREDAPPVRFYLPGTPTPENRAVTGVEVGGGLPPRAGERGSLVVRADAWPRSDAGPETVAVRLVVDGAVRGAATVPAGASAVLPLPAAPAGLVTGHVETDADALTGDDRRHFAYRADPPPTVALADSLPFLAEALAVLADAGRLRRTDLAAAGVVVAPGAMGAEAVRRGAAVVVLPPASPVELAAANQRLARAGLPFRYGQPRGGEVRLDATAELAGALGDVRLREVYPLETAADPDGVLLRLRDGSPWAVAGGIEGGGRYVALATPLVPDAGTIPTSAAMLPLLDLALNTWAADASPPSDARPGAVVSLPEADAVVGPDGTERTLPGRLLRLEEPGLHRVVRAGETVAVHAVNPAPEESDLTREDPGRLADLLPGRDVRLAGAERWGDIVFAARLGRDATLPLVAAAGILLLLEALLAATGRPGARGGAANAQGSGPRPRAGAAGDVRSGGEGA